MRNRQTQRTIKMVSRTGLPTLKGNQSCRGQALVEFTLVAMFFFLLAFATMDFCWLLFNQMNMQDAVREAARYASTGGHVPDPSGPSGSTLSRAASITTILNQSAAAGGTNISTIVISSATGGVCNSSSVGPQPAGCAGQPGDIVTIQATCNVPLLTTALAGFFTGNQFTFIVRASFKNEPFPSGLTD